MATRCNLWTVSIGSQYDTLKKVYQNKYRAQYFLLFIIYYLFFIIYIEILNQDLQ